MASEVEQGALEQGTLEHGALTERDLAILEFEREAWPHGGAKEEAIRERFSLGAARYYQLLNSLIDSPDAVRHDPILVRRLQRTRDARTAARASRTFADLRPGVSTPEHPHTN